VCLCVSNWYNYAIYGFINTEKFVCIFNGVFLCVYVFQIDIIMSSMVSLTLEESIKVTQKQKNEGIDILQCVRYIVMVLKVFNFKEMKRGFDQDEELNESLQLFGYVLVMDSNVIVTIIYHKAIEPTTTLGYKALWLAHNGGYVERSKCKEFITMTMFD